MGYFDISMHHVMHMHISNCGQRLAEEFKSLGFVDDAMLVLI